MPTLTAALEHSVATRVADGVLTRVFSELDILQQTLPTEEWAQKLIDILTFSQAVETGFTHAKAYVLVLLKDGWEQLPFDFRMKLGLSFDYFAQIYTGGKSQSTIDNYLNTARTWFLKKIRPAGLISTTSRLPDGRPIVLNGVPQRLNVEFNPYNVDITKLLILNGKANRGELTDRLWEMLVDPFYSCDDIIRGGMPATPDPNPDYVTFFVEGPGLYASFNGQTFEVVAELDWESYDTDPDFKTVLSNMFTRLGVTLDEQKIINITHQSYS